MIVGMEKMIEIGRFRFCQNCFEPFACISKIKSHLLEHSSKLYGILRGCLYNQGATLCAEECALLQETLMKWVDNVSSPKA